MGTVRALPGRDADDRVRSSASRAVAGPVRDALDRELRRMVVLHRRELLRRRARRRRGPAARVAPAAWTAQDIG